jgi:hypothetical protein
MKSIIRRLYNFFFGVDMLSEEDYRDIVVKVTNELRREGHTEYSYENYLENISKFLKSDSGNNEP